MACFADLTPYVYGYYGREAPDVAIVNIGWLSKAEHFITGEVPEEFVTRLADLVTRPVNLYRGWHNCEWCGGGFAPRKEHLYGNGEIRVTKDGVTYVAPVLVAHYVTAHQYRPPQEFIDAVLSAPKEPV